MDSERSDPVKNHSLTADNQATQTYQEVQGKRIKLKFTSLSLVSSFNYSNWSDFFFLSESNQQQLFCVVSTYLNGVKGKK